MAELTVTAEITMFISDDTPEDVRAQAVRNMLRIALLGNGFKRGVAEDVKFLSTTHERSIPMTAELEIERDAADTQLYNESSSAQTRWA